jgi:hypothetical protein
MSRHAFRKDLSLMADKDWSKRFDEPIVLDDGTTLTTLRQAIEYLAKTVRQSTTIRACSQRRTTSPGLPSKTTRCSLPERQRCRPSTGIASGSSIPIAKTTPGKA